MRITKPALLAAVVLAACSGGGNGTNDAGRDAVIVDAPEFAPVITGLSANPSVITTPGVATPVTFMWSYLVEPTYPDPTCTIDNGVGPVMRGVPVNVTISQLTVLTLTCTNRAGQASRQVILNVPAAAPALATFTVSPTSVTAGVSTPITFTWTYSNTPNPPPTCSIDGGTTNITSGTPISIPLTQARTFRLRCTNTTGTVYSGTTPADVTVAANECGTAYAQCDPHATCNETVNGYTCACTGTYTGNGDTCNYMTTTSTDCDATNCPFNTNQCVPKAGYYGSGQVGDCKRARFTFVTSTTYNATTIGSLANADALCAARATAGGLPGTYIAWLSDSSNDAYCRAQSDGTATGHYNGKKSANCGQGSLPSTAGPWVRVGNSTTGYKQWSPTIDKLLAPNHITYYAANTDETGAEIAAATERVWTGTDDTGQYVANGTCADWTSTAANGIYGAVHGGGESWGYYSATPAICSNTYHLRCMEVSNQAPPTLPPRHPTAKLAFITSVSGNGNLPAWPDAYGQTTGYYTVDNICQARARYAGYANPQTFKAWAAYPNYIINKFFATTSAYARPDGVILGTNRSDMLDGKLAAAWYETETNSYLAGNFDTGLVATNITQNNTSGTYAGTYTNMCLYWGTNSSSYYYYSGRYDLLDWNGFNANTITYCDQTTVRLLCAEDQ